MFKSNRMYRLMTTLVLGLSLTGLVGLITPATPTHAQTTCYGRTVTLYAQPRYNTYSSGNQVIMGTPWRDVIYAGPNDIVCGMDGNDTIYGLGVDKYGGITVLGGPGDDRIVGSDHGGDLVFGGQGNDVISGGSVKSSPPNGQPRLRTIIYGDDGNDTIYANRYGKTYVNGGNGTDTCYEFLPTTSPNTLISCELIRQ